MIVTEKLKNKYKTIRKCDVCVICAKSEYLNKGELLIGEFSIEPIMQEGEQGVVTTVSDPTEQNVYEKNVDNGY